MRKWLIAQRQKPKHVRDNIAFGVASGLTLLLVGGWFFVVPREDIRGRDPETINNQPFSTFADQLQEQLAGARDSIESSVVKSSSSTAETAATSTLAATSTNNEESVVDIIVMPSASTTASSTTSLGL